jgi:hypothetical protein
LIAQRIAQYVSNLLPRTMMMRSVRSVNEMPNPPRVDHDFAELTAYFAREMALGRLARGDPTIPALTLFHATAGFAFSLASQSTTLLLDTTRFLEDFVQVLWRGLEPREGGT